jgi:hypothetical protein
MKYRMWEHHTQAERIIDAPSLEAAFEEARAWAAAGDYDRRVSVLVHVEGLDENGEPTEEYTSDYVDAGPLPVPPKTVCGEEDSDHDWEAVGSKSSGLTHHWYERCRRCELRKETISCFDDTMRYVGVPHETWKYTEIVGGGQEAQ